MTPRFGDRAVLCVLSIAISCSSCGERGVRPNYELAAGEPSREIVVPIAHLTESADSAGGFTIEQPPLKPREVLLLKGSFHAPKEDVSFVLVEFRYRGQQGHWVTANSGITSPTQGQGDEWDYSVNFAAPAQPRNDYDVVIKCGAKYLARSKAVVQAK